MLRWTERQGSSDINSFSNFFASFFYLLEFQTLVVGRTSFWEPRCCPFRILPLILRWEREVGSGKKSEKRFTELLSFWNFQSKAIYYTAVLWECRCLWEKPSSTLCLVSIFICIHDSSSGDPLTWAVLKVQVYCLTFVDKQINPKKVRSVLWLPLK